MRREMLTQLLAAENKHSADGNPLRVDVVVDGGMIAIRCALPLNALDLDEAGAREFASQIVAACDSIHT